MKPATYSMSDSESEAEDADTDNDDIIFKTEAIIMRAACSKPKFEEKRISPLKKKNPEKTKQNPKTASKNIHKKAEKKQKVEIVKQPKPADLIKLVSVVIDSSLLNLNFGSELLAALRSADIRYNVQEQKQPSTITWTIEDTTPHKFFENYIILLWTWKDFVKFTAEGRLSSELKEKVKSSPDSKLTLVTFGMEEYFRKSKTWKNREMDSHSADADKISCKGNKNDKTAVLNRMDVEMAVAELQLLNLQYRFFESGEDLGLYIAQFTKALTELPLKLEKNKRLECADWYATGDSRECIRVDSAGNGFMSLWQQQICQFPNVTLDIAQAIVSNYGSPVALMNAYDSCPSRRDAELLLENIPIRRMHGPLTSVRKIGPELSKKMHHFFCGADGNLLIS